MVKHKIEALVDAGITHTNDIKRRISVYVKDLAVGHTASVCLLLSNCFCFCRLAQLSILFGKELLLTSADVVPLMTQPLFDVQALFLCLLTGMALFTAALPVTAFYFCLCTFPVMCYSEEC